MRICIVNAVAPPAAGSRSERTAHLAREFCALGHDVTVLRAELPGNFGPIDHDLMPASRENLRIVALRAGVGASLKYPPVGPGNLNRVMRAAGQLIWPDWWSGFGVAAVRWLLPRAPEFDVLVASAFPWTSVLVAYEVGRRTRLPWVADYGDPWTLHAKGNRWRRGIDFPLERHMLRGARAVFVTTERTADLFRVEFGLEPSRVVVAPAGVPTGELGPAPNTGPLRLLHAGAVYGPRTSPVPLIEAVERIRRQAPGRIELAWYGELDDLHQRERVRAAADSWAAHVGSQGLLEEERSAHVQIVLGNRGGSQIPAKIWRSLGSGRPVLVVVADEQDPLGTLPELTGRGVVCRNDPDAIEQGLRKLLQTEQERRAGAPAPSPPVALRNWRDRAAQYIAVMGSAAAERPGVAMKRAAVPTYTPLFSLLLTISCTRALARL